MTAVRQAALARAMTDRFLATGNYEVPDSNDGTIKIINHDNPRRNVIIRDAQSLERFFKTWNGPGWVIVRVNSLALQAA